MFGWSSFLLNSGRVVVMPDACDRTGEWSLMETDVDLKVTRQVNGV
ncbi:hypothetical protein Patl1_10343 [Pistacia atlantica]|uniref:Uncharacterized protein n=1 Tax=Pistacia atlantica TaxID=434234 RepID=A0ACC1A1E6_9ROSI|nr:hypothetical protein Patl1_10343 [Pistacia atlantica]